MVKFKKIARKASRKITLANDNPAFKDINPAFRPTDVPPMEPLERNRKPDLKSTARKAGMPEPYPATTPENPDLRTVGEDSISTERVTLSVRMRFNPLLGLTPERYVDYVDQFWIGFFRQAAVMWDKMELRDPVIKTVAPKRKKAVSRHGYEILTVKNIPPGMEALANAQKETLDYFYGNLTATDAVKPDEQGGLSLLTRQMMDAQCKYYAVHEVVWQPSPDGLTAQFVFCPLWWFEGVTGKLRYLDNEFQVYGRDMNAAEWLVTCGEGLMEAAGVARTFMTLSLTDWLGYTEKFGQAFIDAATSASPGSAEWDALKQYVQNFGPDGGGVRSNSATINLLQPSNASNVDAFAKMVEHMEKLIVTLFRGSDLGTHAKANMTGASLQGDETSILEDDDCTLIEETLATKVSRFVIQWAHGTDVPVLAYIKFNRSDKQNVELDLKVDQFLVDAGAPVRTRATLERYGRECPDSVGEEDVLESTPKLATMPDTETADVKIANTGEPADDLAATLHETLLPVLKRLEAIAAVPDAGIQQHLIEKLLKDFPAIRAAIAADDSLARKLSPLLEKSFVAGLTDTELANSDFDHAGRPGQVGGSAPGDLNLRETKVPVPDSVFQQLGIKKGNVFADYTALRNKHPDDFKTSQEVKAHVEHVLAGPTHILPGNMPDHRLLVRKNGGNKVVVVEVELRGGKYRVRSAHLISDVQLAAKIKAAGGSRVNPG